ncbi:MAG: hypothetical protein V5B44_00175 [Candidatus Accumulibacter necessarius]|uniref:hypothetical protein n=1 Tax=Candidatus Accumulibacter necessarius TaxID=2954386 RepID=UPI002FC2F576
MTKQRNYDAALRAIDRAFNGRFTAYQILKLRIRKHLKANVETKSKAVLILKDFGDPVNLDDWELGWFIAAADLAGDKHASEAGRRIRQSRKSAGPVDSGGLRPDMTGKRE